jgi:hypothetical protein
MDYHRLLVILRSCYSCRANRVPGNDSDLAQRTADSWVRNGARRAGTYLYRRIHCLAWHFALAGRVLGASHVEKIPIARLDSGCSLASPGRADFRSLRNLGRTYGTNCGSRLSWEGFPGTSCWARQAALRHPSSQQRRRHQLRRPWWHDSALSHFSCRT